MNTNNKEYCNSCKYLKVYSTFDSDYQEHLKYLCTYKHKEIYDALDKCTNYKNKEVIINVS